MTLLFPAILIVLTAVLIPFRGNLTRAGPALALVLPVVWAGLLGGRGPAIAVAVLAATVFNFAFSPLTDWSDEARFVASATTRPSR